MRSVGRWAHVGVVMLLSLLAAKDVAAWGDTGHEIICEIAFQKLTPQARARVIQLLRQDPDVMRFSTACTWPDHPRTRGRIDWGRPVPPGRHLRGHGDRQGCRRPVLGECLRDGEARGAEIPRPLGG